MTYVEFNFWSMCNIVLLIPYFWLSLYLLSVMYKILTYDISGEGNSSIIDIGYSFSLPTYLQFQTEYVIDISSK